MSTSISLGSSLRTLVRPVLPVSDPDIALMERHFALLLKWNARMNLTRVTDPAEAAVRHYGESLFLASHLNSGTVLDIGSGPGFPGIPAAIARPDCRFTLIDSNHRKCVFLREAARDLPNVRIADQRAQDVHEHYDWAVSRAVSVPEVVGLGIAARVALLIGEEDASTLNGFDVIPLPWGHRRVLAISR